MLIAADPGEVLHRAALQRLPRRARAPGCDRRRRAHGAADGRLAHRRAAPARGRVRRGLVTRVRRQAMRPRVGARGRRSRRDWRAIAGGSSTVEAWRSRRVFPGPARREPPTPCCSRSCCSGRATSRPCATPSTSFHPLAFSSRALRARRRALRARRVVEGGLAAHRAARPRRHPPAGRVGIFANQVAVIYAVQKAGAANVGMLMASAPIIAALLAPPARARAHRRAARASASRSPPRARCSCSTAAAASAARR